MHISIENSKYFSKNIYLIFLKNPYELFRICLILILNY